MWKFRDMKDDVCCYQSCTEKQQILLPNQRAMKWIKPITFERKTKKVLIPFSKLKILTFVIRKENAFLNQQSAAITFTNKNSLKVLHLWLVSLRVLWALATLHWHKQLSVSRGSIKVFLSYISGGFYTTLYLLHLFSTDVIKFWKHFLGVRGFTVVTKWNTSITVVAKGNDKIIWISSVTSSKDKAIRKR